MHKVIVPWQPMEGNETMLDLPIAGITRAACIRIIAEQLASTLATSAVEIALAARDSPGHPYYP